MQIIVDVMMTAFLAVKESGSYLLFYLLAIGLGLIVAWDRYANKKNEDNWMLEETKKQIQLWPFLFSLLALILVVANPVCIWIMNKITPIQGQYERSWVLLMAPFLVAHGVVCFFSMLTEQRLKNILVLGMVILIGLAGSSYGILSERQSEEASTGERQAVEAILEILSDESDMAEKPVLAANAVIEYSAVYSPGIPLLYGKDLYTPNLDLGIMDAYSPELMGIYEAMKHPEENLELLAEMALLYDCGIIVVDNFEKAPRRAGSFTLYEETQDYLIYQVRSR